MLRARVLLAVVAAGLFISSGCCFHPLADWHRHRGNDCDCVCGNTGAYETTGLDGPVLVPPPDGLGAVPLVTPPPGTAPPGPVGAPPRVVPIPQANPTPYTPTKWFRNKDRDRDR
jgi:hypothetical protein